MICVNCTTKIEGEHTTCSNPSCNKVMHMDCVAKCIKCGEVICDTCSLANKFMCNKCSKEDELVVDYLRRSSIETYKTCPYQYYLQEIAKVPSVENVYATNGIILHDLFAKYSQNPELTKEEFYEEYRIAYSNIPDDRFDSPNQKEALYEKGKNSIKGYFEEEAKMPFPYMVEQDIFAKVDDTLPPLRITMDRINGDPKEGDYDLVDYKTGKVHVGQKLSNDLQPPMYAYVLGQHFGKMPKRIIMLFLAEEKRREYILQDDDKYVCVVNKRRYEVSVTEAIREIKSLWSRIKRRDFRIPGQMSHYVCSSNCYYGKSGQCAGTEQRWHNAGKQL